MEWKIPLFKTYSDQADVDSVSEVIKRGTFWAVGKEIEEFEKKLADYVETKYALAFNSGTSALHSLLLAYGIKDREVIVPSFTFIATANAVLLAEGKPVFAESENETFGLDFKSVKSKITEKTKAIILMHYAGLPARDTEKIRQLAKEKNIILIEDAAESLGASINEKMIGSFGDSSMFSFCQNKILAIGEGGLITTNNREIYEKCKLIRSQGRVEEAEDYFASTGDNDYIIPGYNFRMPTICAALGLSQFNKIDKVISLRREKANYLNEKLLEIKEITLPKQLENHYQVYQMYTIQLPNKKIRDNLQNFLAENGIMTKVYFNPIHLKSVYSKQSWKEGELPITEEISNKVLTLPFYPQITFEELDFILNSIKKFFKNIKE
jgi:perosamine synthetase